MSAIGDFNRSIWLLLLSKGGWWSAAEIEYELSLTAGSIAWRLQKLFERRSIVRRKAPNRVHGAQYAVRNDCTVPQGMSVGEVIASATGNMQLVDPDQDSAGPAPHVQVRRPLPAPTGSSPVVALIFESPQCAGHSRQLNLGASQA